MVVILFGAVAGFAQYTGSDLEKKIPETLYPHPGPGDLMMITADHGNDPTFPGSDHTREYAPLLVYGKSARQGVNLGTRDSLADIGQTIAGNFGLRLTAGESFLQQLQQAEP